MSGEGPTVTATLDYSHRNEEVRLRVDVEGGREKEMRADQRLQLAITEAKDRAERRCRRDGVTDELKVTVSYLDARTSTDIVEREQLHLDRDSEAESEVSDSETDLQSWNRPDQVRKNHPQARPVEEGPEASSRGRGQFAAEKTRRLRGSRHMGDECARRRRRGKKGKEGTSGRKRPRSVQKQPQPGALGAKGPIDINTAYFLEWKDDVWTKREFFISPSRVVEIGDWEASYNRRSLDPVHTQLIIDTMMMVFSQAKKTYELPTLKLAPLGLEKPKPGVRADRLKPADWKDDLAGQNHYYVIFGQHNAAAAKVLLGTNVALRYNFERWPARMVYFSDEEFEGYFLVSSGDNKKDLKAPPRQMKLSMKDIRWLWKEKGFLKTVMGNPSGKQAQVQKWHKFCEQALHKTPYYHL
ncbi:hypothetical protein CBR_g5570 [Chara braunii]|uniref:Ubiquitin-like protease family profile domain-containing protein n=1 Tax=Chara braunii TaxID=69332 RepID=A0A388JRG4_CHABU|nr:hypothetical protein CBR_g5570 [Chara braunii]|eukprot:GBG60394.1 hypothetical protein CBR_g5570 [Chara braunii]